MMIGRTESPEVDIQRLRQFAEMQINMARRDQSASRLALIRHQLAHAKVSAPQAGVVVEGELKKNLGAPLRKGDLLLKLAQGESSYLELEIVGNYALLGLSAAKKLGLEVDAQKVTKAFAWIEDTASGDGGVGYSPRPGQKGKIGRAHV